MHVMVFKVRVYALFHSVLEVFMKYELMPVCLRMCYSKLHWGFEWIYKCIKCINSLNYYHGSPLILVYHKPKHASNQTCLFHVLFICAVSHGLVHICLNVWLLSTYVVNQHLHTDKTYFFRLHVTYRFLSLSWSSSGLFMRILIKYNNYPDCVSKDTNSYSEFFKRLKYSL